MAADSGGSGGWLVHDVVVGALAGGAAGIVAAVFALARVDSPILATVAIAVGIAVGIALLRWERHRRVGAGPVTVIAYVVMLLSVGFMLLLVNALRNFT